MVVGYHHFRKPPYRGPVRLLDDFGCLKDDFCQKWSFGTLLVQKGSLAAVKTYDQPTSGFFGFGLSPKTIHPTQKFPTKMI